MTGSALESADDLELLVSTLAAELATLADAFTLVDDQTAAEIGDTSTEGGGIDDVPPPSILDDPSAYEPPTSASAPQKDAASPTDGFWRRRSTRTHEALSEQFRHLAAVLHHAQETLGAHTVLIGSALEGEGKSMTAVNLAVMLSRSYQRRVLLIDADLRRPSLHDLLQLPNLTGLSTIYSHPERATVPIVKVSPTLSVLTAGPTISDPSSFLISDDLRQLVAEAAQDFDWVVLDTSPVALFADASLLAAMADTALLVVAAHSTPYPLVRLAIESIGQQRLLGIVLNRTPTTEIRMADGLAMAIPAIFEPSEPQRSLSYSGGL
jgi:protein-tyrosine kinase